MKNKKKSFYFEDYTESELTDNKSNTIKISINRVTFLSFIFFSLMVIFSIKVIYLSLSPEKILYSKNIKKNYLKHFIILDYQDFLVVLFYHLVFVAMSLQCIIQQLQILILLFQLKYYF